MITLFGFHSSLLALASLGGSPVLLGAWLVVGTEDAPDEAIVGAADVVEADEAFSSAC